MLNLLLLKNHLISSSKNLTKKELYKKIALIRKELNIKEGDYPIDLISILQKTNIFNIVITDIGDISGCLIKSPINKPIIMISQTTPSPNFVLAHEFIHFLISPEETKSTIKDECFNYSNTYEEWCANEGGAELLIPHKDFIYNLSYSLKWKSEKDALDALSLHYKVSKTVIKYRILSLLDLFSNNPSLKKMKNYFDSFDNQSI